MNNVRSNRLAALQRRANENQVVFLETELAFGSTLAEVAPGAVLMDQLERAERTARHAADAYSEVARFLADPKQASRVPDEQRQKIEAGMERLRKELDRLPESSNKILSE